MRFLFLFLVLIPSLSWATINAASFQRTVAACTGSGNREAQYPSGGATCIPPESPQWFESFVGFTVSTTAYAAIDADDELEINENLSKDSGEDANAYQITSTYCRDGDNQSMLIANNVDILGPEGKLRQEVKYWASIDLQPETEYWIGYSMMLVDWPEGTEAGGDNFMIDGQITTLNGPILLRQFYHDCDNPPDCTITDGKVKYNVRYYNGPTDGSQVPHNYWYRKGVDENTSSSYDDFPIGQWVDFVIRWRHSPAATTGYVKIWLIEEDATSTVLVDDANIQLGFTDESGEIGVPFVGTYHGLTDQPTGFTYKTVYDNFKAYQGANGYSVVAPSGTPCP